ncbi:cholecystokinin receptor-like [Patella vulgata]|uniref:cholecystokinin receptor-like n=1 Tax=Patella vulgata TaxID=6465 RepID=UPI00217FA4B4|nr:cholecystokinin receptor-like [Patella vulgata]
MKTTAIMNSTSMTNISYTEEEINSYLDELCHEARLRFMPAIIFVGILGLIGLVGNTLVLIVYYKSFKPKATRSFILCVTVFDLTTNVVVIPNQIIEYGFQYRYPTNGLCVFNNFMRYTMAYGSTLSLALICFQRYNKICRPLKRQIEERTACKLVIACIALSNILGIPTFFLFKMNVIETDRVGILGRVCEPSDVLKDSIFPFIHSLLQLITCILFETFFIVLYSLIGFAIYKQRKFRNELQLYGALDRPKCMTRETGRQKVTKRHKTTFMMVIITATYVLCFLPVIILNTVDSVLQFRKNLTGAKFISYIIIVNVFYINAAVNPIVFSFMDERFRNGLMKLFKIKAKHKI